MKNCIRYSMKSKYDFILYLFCLFLIINGRPAVGIRP